MTCLTCIVTSEENIVSCKNLCLNLLYMYIYNKICSNRTHHIHYFAVTLYVPLKKNIGLQLNKLESICPNEVCVKFGRNGLSDCKGGS